MEDTLILIFICLAVPLFMSIFVFKGESKLLSIFLCLGLFIAVVSAYLNEFFRQQLGIERIFATYTLTPVVEEVMKAFPIFLYGMMLKPKRSTILHCSMMVGIGFAMLENAYIITGAAGNVTLLWALIRGFGTGLMHATCTAFIGYGVSYINIRRKLFVIGIYGLLTMAVLYHANFNLIAISENPYLTLILPVVIFALLVFASDKLQTILKKRGTGKKAVV